MAFVLGLAVWATGPSAEAQAPPVLEITLHREIRITGEVGATYVIESKAEVEGDFWVTRGWIKLTTRTAMWTDPAPTEAPCQFYRALKVTKPAVQTIANMVWIPPGTFVMGSPESERGRDYWEGPQTRVTLTKGFWLGKYEVTQREYLAVMGSNPSHFQPPVCPKDLDRPVESVSWDDAVAYCAKLTIRERAGGRLATRYEYRLPTAAQWEYACRVGTTTRFSFGDALGCDDEGGFCALLDSYMWWAGNNNPEGTRPVGRKTPNPWGLYDMHGNVWEWCDGYWSDHLTGGSVVDPAGPGYAMFRPYRGGGWGTLARRCRSAYYYGLYPWNTASGIGFRVLLTPGQ